MCKKRDLERSEKELQDLIDSTHAWFDSDEGKASMKECFEDIAKWEKKRLQDERDSQAHLARMMNMRITI